MSNHGQERNSRNSDLRMGACEEQDIEGVGSATRSRSIVASHIAVEAAVMLVAGSVVDEVMCCSSRVAADPSFVVKSSVYVGPE